MSAGWDWRGKGWLARALASETQLKVEAVALALTLCESCLPIYVRGGGRRCHYVTQNRYKSHNGEPPT
jgi:hypothetical protein